MTDSWVTLSASREFCHQTARRAGSNFYPCFLLLPRVKRQAMEALYAFMRHTDDLGDNALPIDERRAALAHWRSCLLHALQNGRSMGKDVGWVERSEPHHETPSDPVVADSGATAGLSSSAMNTVGQANRGTQSISTVSDPFVALLPALADAVRSFHIPVASLTAVLDGVEMDLNGRRYDAFEDLERYCECVASAVGLACIHIWGIRGHEALEPSRKCGVAFQLTNILRDLKEDAAEGRLYLPQADLRACGYTMEDIACGVADDRFLRFMEIQIDRAQRLYREGAELFGHLEPDGRRVFGMMMSVYWRLLKEIERAPQRVLERRIRLPRWKKLAIAARWTLLPPRRSSLP